MAGAAAAPQLFTLKGMRVHDKFDGSQENFEVYFYSLESEVTAMGWRFIWDAAKTMDALIAISDVPNPPTGLSLQSSTRSSR